MGANLAENLTATAQQHGDRTALKLDDAEMTYAQLDDASARLAGLLTEKGVGPGERVGIMLPNVPYFAVVYYGVLRAGAVGEHPPVVLHTDGGELSGQIVAGPNAGHLLDEFDLPQLTAMMAGFDAESVALLESYLDRRFPAWRQHAQGNAAGGQSRPAASGKMTDEEAYQILGLQPGAGRDEIGRAHRALMKKLHPDQGGSTYLASRVNEAKDTLLRTHHS